MKKTLSIHLGRQLFVIEEDAYDRLQAYLKKLEASLANESGSSEIVEDIEMRFAELLTGYMGATRQVVTISDIEKGIESLGEPEVISEEQEQPKNTQTQQTTNSQKRMYRDMDNAMIGGVAGGLAAYLHLDPVIIRILLVVFLFMGFGFFLYIVLWIIIPEAKTPAERLQMRGQPVNIDTLKEEIEKGSQRIRTEVEGAAYRIKNKTQHISKQASMVVSVVSKIFGVAFLIGSLIFLMISILIISGIIDVFPTTGDQDYASLSESLRLVVPANKSFSLIWIGIILVAFCLPLLGLAIGIRLLIGKVNRYFKWNFFIFPTLIFIGIFCGIVGGINAARDYETYTWHSNQKLTSSANELILEELPLIINHHQVESSGGIDFISIRNGEITEHGITIIYRESKDSLFHISQAYKAHGIDLPSAQKRAMHIKHQMRIEGNKLLVNPYYSFPSKDGFRNQEIKLVIEVPRGKKLFINNQEVLVDGREYEGELYANEPFEAYENYNNW